MKARALASMGLAFLVTMAPTPAAAMDGPFSWAESVCLADALVEVEVVVAKGGRPRADVRAVLWNGTSAKTPKPQIGFGLPNRAYLERQLRAHERGETAGYDPAVIPLYREALARGRYRVVHALMRVPRGGFVGVEGVVGFSLEHWEGHPRHRVWRAYLDRLVKARNEAWRAGKRKPATCSGLPGERAIEALAAAEDAAY